MSEQDKFFGGLDIGGTTVKTVLVDASGDQVGEMVEVRSKVDEGYQQTFGQLRLALEELAQGAGIGFDQIRGVGLDVPAPCCDGVVWSKANLAQDWVGVDIRSKLSEFLGIPVYMTNDGSAAAVGEYALRRKHLGSLLFVAPGTGLAGGLVLPGGQIYEGANGLSLEVGHNTVPHREDDGELPQCSCGMFGCTEAWVSLVALRRRVRLELAKPENAGHALNQGGLSDKEQAFALRDYASNGDALAVSIFRQQGEIFGHALADLTRLFDPGLIVIGGGLAETSFRDQYLEWVMTGFTKRAWPVYIESPVEPGRKTTRFEWAIGGDAAGAMGMGYTARELYR
jgi:glucokinase